MPKKNLKVHRGRPGLGYTPKEKTLRLDPDQWADLQSLARKLPGRPDTTGLIRDAIQEFIQRQLHGKALELSQEQRHELEVLGSILPGSPSVNGLVHSAVKDFMLAQLKDERMRTEFNAKAGWQLHIG